MNDSYAPAIREAILQRDERHLRDILSRIPEKDRDQQVNEPLRGDPPLLSAAATGRVGLTTALLEAGANVHRRDSAGHTALHLAAAYGHAPNVAKLIEHGAQVDARTEEYGETPLMRAAQLNRAAAVNTLLDYGANPDLVNRQGHTAEAMAVGEAQQVLVAHRERPLLRQAAGLTTTPDTDDQPRARRRM